jgi:uncharacterized RDD family membrane protein YckC
VNEQRVVSPEAVPLEFDTASVGARAVGLLIDFAIQGVAAVAVAVAGAATASALGEALPGWIGPTIAVLAGFGLLWGYPIGFEVGNQGRTPGMMVMGLRVITVEGAPVGLRHATIRALLGLVDFHLFNGVVALVTALATPRHQRVGDLVAGTLVLRERTGARTPRPAQFAVPAGAEAYATTVDPAGLGNGDYETVRSFLLRASSMPAKTRADVAERLASSFAGLVNHQRPESITPEVFLTCLAARYQQRSTTAAPSTPGTGRAPAAADAGQSSQGRAPSGSWQAPWEAGPAQPEPAASSPGSATPDTATAGSATPESAPSETGGWVAPG